MAADQVKQQIERTFKCLEEYLQRVGRNVQVLGKRRNRFAVNNGERHLGLGRRLFLVLWRLWRILGGQDSQFGLHTDSNLVRRILSHNLRVKRTD